MSTDPIRSLEALNSAFRSRLEGFLDEMKGIDPMEAHETLRTQERQNFLQKDGASKIKRSRHQDGEAADLHFTTGVAFPPGGDKRWIKAAEIAKKHGIDCGGVLWNWDWNHFEYHLDEWQKNAINWATKKGVSNGERPLSSITRVEVMEMLRKFSV